MEMIRFSIKFIINLIGTLIKFYKFKTFKCDLSTRILEQSEIEDFCREYGKIIDY